MAEAGDAVPEMIAHRGASFDAPENTLASLRLGWEQGADAGELDIQLSRDGQAVVLHDSSTLRTTGSDKPVREQTLAELKRLDAGSWKDPRWTGERIPSLSEALQIIPLDKKLVIEIKGGQEMIPVLEKALRKSDVKPNQILLIAFDYPTILLAKQQLPNYEAYWLVSYRQDSRTGKLPQVEDLIQQARKGNLNGLNLHFSFPMDPAFVAQVKAAGLKLYVWTVDDPALARRLQGAGVDGITTNRPGWMREQLKTKPQP